MKRKIYVILKRYKGYIVSFGILIFLIILLMIFHRAFSKQEILKIETDSYIISYDNTWNITEQTAQKVNLKHKQSDSKISIEIQELENDSNYLEISDFIEEIRYLIETQNTGYRSSTFAGCIVAGLIIGSGFSFISARRLYHCFGI